MIYRLAMLLVTVSILSSCSNSNSQVPQEQNDLPVANEPSDSTNTPTSPPEPEAGPESISGGSPSDPTVIQTLGTHSINNNPFFNYFNYVGMAGERLSVSAILSIPVSAQQMVRCIDQPTAHQEPFIRIFASDGTTVGSRCGDRLNVILPDNDTYTLFFEYPSNGSGTFQIASTTGDSAISNPNGELGVPSNPKQLILRSENQLSENPFENHFRYSANAGDVLVMNVQLDNPVSQFHDSRCSDQPQSTFERAIHLYTSDYEELQYICGESWTFTLDEAGTYIIRLQFFNGSSGQLFADVL